MKLLDIEDFSAVFFPSFEAINVALKHQSDDDYPVPIFRKVLIRVGSGYYYFIAEAWFPGCLEDRAGDWGQTNKRNIAGVFKQLMTNEADFSAYHSGYVMDSPAGEYGVTWIASGNKADVIAKYFSKKSSSKSKKLSK